MAPKKTSKKPQTALENQPRRSPRLSNLPPTPSEPSLPEPPKKKAKTTPKTPVPEPEVSKKAKATPKTPVPEPEVSKKTTTPKPKNPKTSKLKKTIIIEHCNQCKKNFKTRATQVKEGLEQAVEGVTIILNPNPPRRGCFEIREENGETFVTLLDMKRPFAALQKLEMEKVISDIVEKIK